MHGKILDYNGEMKSGYVRDEKERKYHFFIGDCTNPDKLQMGAEVEFSADGERAMNITVLDMMNDPSALKAKLAKETALKRSKKMINAALILILTVGIGGLIVALVFSEMEHRKVEKLQDLYDSQIQNIKKYIRYKQCSEAALEYARADATRNAIDTQSGYYSLEKHEVQAHAIDIAECFAQRKDFAEAIGMLDIEKVNDVDYLTRASIIYKKAGETSKAHEAAFKAAKYVPIR